MTKFLLTSIAIALVAGCAQQPPMQPRPIDFKLASCSKPEYPISARRYDAEGTTRLTFIVDSQGMVSNAAVAQSSGTTTAHKILDQTALQALLTCRLPASPGYRSAPGRLDYVWKLDNPESYADKIRATLRFHLLLPESIEGNPTAEVELRTAPDGKLINTKLLKSSGSASWDTAVQEAIAKIERMPLDINGKVPPIMVITFTPQSLTDSGLERDDDVAKGAEVEYRVDFKARWAGTAHEGDIEISPQRLLQIFGQPLFNDGDFESLGTYVFTSPEGKVLTLYYRAYDVPRRQIEAQRVAFWRQEQEVGFHIGAKDAHDVPAFKAWLVKRLGTDGS